MTLIRILTMTLALLLTRAVYALPEFARKEGKSCLYCHATAAWGGNRNYRSEFFRKHGRSFASFDAAAEAKKAGVPVGSDVDPKPKSWSAPKPEVAQHEPELFPGDFHVDEIR